MRLAEKLDWKGFKKPFINIWHSITWHLQDATL
jgi:hypothetical protein